MKTTVTLKINYLLVPAMVVLFGGVLVVVRQIADRTAFEETNQTARLIMAAAQATFDYTVEQVNPSLTAKYDFLVQSVSAYAATETIGRMQHQFHDYRYHVAALNPTNKRDLADAWEKNAILTLARDGAPAEVSEVRDLPNGRFALIAIPIRVTNGECLTCHSVAEAAPRTMIDAYGRENGFGWKLNEVVAAQVVAVPMSVAQERADLLFRGVMYMLGATFVALLVVANAAIYLVVTRRVRPLTRVADIVSKGHLETATPGLTGTDELAELGRAFERMRISLGLAMKTAPQPGAGWPLRAATLDRLKATLAADLGPMASVLVDQASAGAASRQQFKERLLASGPDRERLQQRLTHFDFDV
jgi:protein-histidine pros-kinase